MPLTIRQSLKEAYEESLRREFQVSIEDFLAW